MTALTEHVRALVMRLAPDPICDACVAERLGLESAGRANPATRLVGGVEGFERRRDICSLCYGERLVTRWRR